MLLQLSINLEILFIDSQADVNSLKNFLSAARLAERGDETSSLPLSTLTPVRPRDVEQPKKKLTIVSKKDYPLTSNFPYSLEQLQVSYCKLSRVDMRMLSLKGRACGGLSADDILLILIKSPYL